MTEERMAEIIANSFKNFHSKGLDYLCLYRSHDLTRKVYFFDGDVTKLPEVVNPHDHRYNFRTRVLAGVMSNSTYSVPDSPILGETYNMFEWRTPLNGGNGFQFIQETRLQEDTRFMYGDAKGKSSYYMLAEEFHTIRMHSDQCILILDQYHDIVPVDKPTLTFMKEKQAPSLDGLYEKFTADEICSRLQILKQFGIG